jgi:DNA repair protein RadC
MGRKLLVSLAMEGKFSREGLQSLDEDDDMLTANARELVTENGVGESAAAVWRQIQAENRDVLNSTIMPPEPVSDVQDAAATTALITAALTIEAVDALKFGTRPLAVRPVTRRREAPLADLQFPLF